MVDISTMRVCSKCSVPYTWKKSSSTLKWTYCSYSCERRDLGFTIESLIKSTATKVCTKD